MLSRKHPALLLFAAAWCLIPTTSFVCHPTRHSSINGLFLPRPRFTGRVYAKTFRVPPESSTAMDERVGDATFQKRNKAWIVLVDDEEAIRASVGQFLFDQGYQVTACADADAVLEVCRGQPPEDAVQHVPRVPDAIVSDVRMPGTDGIQLVRMIREDERLEKIPVIMLTAKAMTNDRVEGYRAGADVYLPKPFNPEELLSILDNTIERQQQMKNSGPNGELRDLKESLSEIKQMMHQNSKTKVKKTDVYLTPSERQVLQLLSEGNTNAEIAKARNVGVSTIVKTTQNMYQVTGTKNRTELVRWALQTGYVRP